MDESKRVSYNNERLLLIDKSVRAKIAAVIKDMEGHGLKPLIAKEVWRNPKEQLALYKAGRSKVSWGFHCACTPDGKPASLAADIIDADLAWNASRKFWLMLGSSAMAHGLGWGGMWGLPKSLKTGLLKVIECKDWDCAVKFGWDVAHIETTNVTVKEARAGKR